MQFHFDECESRRYCDLLDPDDDGNSPAPNCTGSVPPEQLWTLLGLALDGWRITDTDGHFVRMAREGGICEVDNDGTFQELDAAVHDTHIGSFVVPTMTCPDCEGDGCATETAPEPVLAPVYLMGPAPCPRCAGKGQVVDAEAELRVIRNKLDSSVLHPEIAELQFMHGAGQCWSSPQEMASAKTGDYPHGTVDDCEGPDHNFQRIWHDREAVWLNV